ncbi:phosphate signaling complex protein PhoU [Clostridium sp. SHJSY1]|uniref:phosphate signaling complex protein PhoU n=1 Tax=Clostridium sp. SHJSY1 TaxID=2942483 RepID=UPI0028750C3A|nr:phosphate signaling complex protein PhoU [Clostridium sp. SHJSY1]MDS0524959.1 phosphate signaling complex protein PhoU [Clostridium sp. SHJSY1]
MTRISQKSRINEINRKLLLMSNLVEKQIYGSMVALKNHDIKAAEEIVSSDDKVDDLQQQIEEECIKFIATEQPLAKDLRNVFTATKIVTDLERMADHAVDICKITKEINLSSGSFPEQTLALWDMEEQVRKMIDLSINAYIERDVDKAYEICKMDDNVDAIYRRIFADILSIIKVDDSKKEKTAQLLFVAKYLERIGDRVTNICEGTIFSSKGTYVDLNE